MQIDPATALPYFNQSSWFKDIPDDATQSLLAKTHAKEVEANQFLYHVGQPQDSIYCVMTGRVRVSLNSSVGQEFVVVDMCEGNWFGEAALATKKSRVLEAMAVERSTVLVLPSAVVLEVADRFPSIYKKLFNDNMRRTSQVYTLLADMLFYPLKSRLAGRLLTLLNKHGRPSCGGIELDIQLTQQDFASMSMGSRQRVNKIFRDWVKQGIIEKRGDKYLVRDIDSLKQDIELQDID